VQVWAWWLSSVLVFFFSTSIQDMKRSGQRCLPGMVFYFLLSVHSESFSGAHHLVLAVSSHSISQQGQLIAGFGRFRSWEIPGIWGILSIQFFPPLP